MDLFNKAILHSSDLVDQNSVERTVVSDSLWYKEQKKKAKIYELAYALAILSNAKITNTHMGAIVDGTFLKESSYASKAKKIINEKPWEEIIKEYNLL